MTTSSLALLLVLITLISLAETAAQVCFKSAIEKFSEPATTLREMLKLAWRLLFVFRVWVGFWLGLAALALWITVLSKADLNFAYSLSSIHYIFIALASQFILKEDVSRNRWGATLLITAGIVIVSFTGN